MFPQRPVVDGYKIAEPLRGYRGNDLHLVFESHNGVREGVYSTSKKGLVVPMDFLDVRYLGPETFAVKLENGGTGIYSAEKQKVFPMEAGVWVCDEIAPGFIQVWLGRVCGLYSLREERLVLPIAYDSMVVKSGKIVANGFDHIKEIEIA